MPAEPTGVTGLHGRDENPCPDLAAPGRGVAFPGALGTRGYFFVQRIAEAAIKF